MGLGQNAFLTDVFSELFCSKDCKTISVKVYYFVEMLTYRLEEKILTSQLYEVSSV